MKILLIITGLGMGGAERQLCDLADQFVQNGHHVLLISMTGKVISYPQSDAIKIIELRMIKTPIGFIKAYWQAHKIINEFKPDVVHSHMIHANLFSRLLRLTTRIKKLICTAHSTNEGGFFRMLAYRLTDFLCNFSTNVSQEAVNVFVERHAAPKNRIFAMHNGIDTMRFFFNLSSRRHLRNTLSIGDATPMILSVGRLTGAKDYPNLLTAFSLLPKQFSSTQLVIIGTGEEQSNIIALAEKLKLTSRIHFLGLCHNVNEWMSAADIYVMSSAWEGMPLVLLEAMACERVIVATDCGGVKEVVGRYGILVPPKDSTALAQGLTRALGVSAEEAKTQGQLARQRVVKYYSLSAQATSWLELYQ
ncbi:glycosyltransferase [Edwardsiella tarda]|uniref:glycosyltransferase n=1 Tax=Edwardsiella tarda TaxID=636 RepID=UPI003F6569F0